MNPIQKLIQTEISNLIEKSKGYQAINHNATKGNLREKLLINFFKKLIPDGLSISSGIICDSSGKSSNQTDFIIYDRKILPNLILDKDLAVIPVEAVYLIAEIKTTLRKNDLTQIENYRASFNKLKLSVSPTNEAIKIPSVVIAYDNKVAEKTLLKWMEEQNDIVSICIINKFTISKTGKGLITFKPDENLPQYWETLNFSLQMFNYLSKRLSTNIIPLWDPYLQGIEKFKEINNLK